MHTTKFEISDINDVTPYIDAILQTLLINGEVIVIDKAYGDREFHIRYKRFVDDENNEIYTFNKEQYFDTVKNIFNNDITTINNMSASRFIFFTRDKNNCIDDWIPFDYNTLRDYMIFKFCG